MNDAAAAVAEELPMTVAASLDAVWRDLRPPNMAKVDIDPIADAVAAGEGVWGSKVPEAERARLVAAIRAINASNWHLESRKNLMKAALVSKALTEEFVEDCRTTADGQPHDPACGKVCATIEKMEEIEPAHDQVLGALLLMPAESFAAIEEKYDGDSRMIAAHFDVPVEAVLLRRRWADLDPTEDMADFSAK